MATHSSLGRAGLNSLYDPPKAAKTPTNTRARITHEVAKKNYLADDDSDDDNNDEEGYSIDPSVQLFKSIDFGRNKGNNNAVSTANSSHSGSFKQKKEVASRALNLANTTPDKTRNYGDVLDDQRATTITVLGNKQASSAASQVVASSSQFDDPMLGPDMSKNERDSLMDALEKMRKQNESLMRQMESAQRQQQQQLEAERNERANAVTRMQAENERLTQSLMKAQQDAENALAAERDKLRSALKQMECEKTELVSKIKHTEDQAQEELFRLQYLQAEQQRKISSLEAEKQSMHQHIQANTAAASQDASKQAELARKNAELEAKMQEMEDETRRTMEAYQQSEAETKQLAEVMNKQLEEERNELQRSLERMEEEKQVLSVSLQTKEREAKEHALALESQLTRDKADLTDAIKRIESNRHLLSIQYKEAEAASSSSKLLAPQLTELQQAKLDMEQQLAQMIKEKEELTMKLKATEEAAAEKLRLEALRQSNEKKELMDAVAKMKADLEAEKASPQSSSRRGESASPTKAANNNPPSPVVNSQNSLFGLMQNDPVKSPHGAEMRSPQHFINSIPEEMEGENFMNIDEDEDDEDRQENDSPNRSAKNDFSDLPAPHEAAALGDLTRLQVLGGLEASLLTSVDANARSPLFYAAAYGRTDVVKYLAEMNPILISSPDAHGDTPLHAAASGGRTESLQLLLQTLSGQQFAGNMEPRNHLGMTPMHMCLSAECMELCYMYGADIAAMDNEGRSPLFIACAMNRHQCAEFLCTSLDQIEQSILLKDHRGDTPLHAAACNGSVECLLLLLQFGIDPCTANDKGLKAIELAIKNKQKQCRQLLTEYHLHFGTSSDFDSVLFLHTLEGHKLAKKAPPVTPYQIIKKASFTSIDPTTPTTPSYSKSPFPSSSTSNPLSTPSPGSRSSANLQMMPSFKKGKSMFSLTSERSLRLQRWGHWIAYEDQNAHTTYWYNPNTGAGQWDKPEEVNSMQQVMTSSSSSSASSRLFANKMSMRLKKVGDWIQYVTESGPTFYYNDKNGDFQWVDPSKQTYTHTGSHVDGSTDAGGEDEAAAGGGPDPTTGSGDWKPYKDPATGNVFWYNKVTKISQWECPLESIPPELLLEHNKGRASRNSNNDSPERHADDYTAVGVDDEDDLGI